MRENHSEAAEREFGTEISLIPEILSFTEGFLKGAGLEHLVFEVSLAIEEWYVNVVKYGFGEKNIGRVVVRFSLSEGVLEVELRDNGAKFDPHSIPPPERPESVEGARIGGLGIHLLRSLMDETDYKRVEGENILIMRKRV